MKIFIGHSDYLLNDTAVEKEYENVKIMKCQTEMKVKQYHF